MSEILRLETLTKLQLEDSGPITPKFDFSLALNLKHFEISESLATPMLKKSTLPTGKKFKIRALQILLVKHVEFDSRPGHQLFHNFPEIKMVKIVGNFSEAYSKTVLASLTACCSSAHTFSVQSSPLANENEEIYGDD